MALLELLAGAAPAGIVAADLLVLVEALGLHGLWQGHLVSGQVGRLGDPGWDGARLAGCGGDRRCAALGVAARVAVGPSGAAADGPLRTLLLLLLDLDLDVEDVARELVPDVVHQRREHLEALVLVGHERVDLGEAAEVDALAQVVHVVQVLAPALVDDLEQHEALERAHELVAELLLALVVGIDDVLADLHDERLAVDPLLDVLGLEGVLVHLVELREQAVEVPVLGKFSREVLAADALDRVRDLLAGGLRHVLALEDPVAVLVDDLALLVHHVVVLEDALADQEVLLLDLLLGVLDLLGEHLGLDRLLLALLADRAQLVEDPVDPVAGEEAHEVVLGGEEEARLAGVALAARAAAKLVVDPPRLVALGAEDEETAGLEHLLALLLHVRLDPREALVPDPVPLLAVRLEAALDQLLVGEVLLVAAQLDVHAAAGHVRGDGHGLDAPGLGDRLALALGVLRLGVEHRVVDALLAEPLGEELGDLDRDRADQDGLALHVPVLDLLDHGFPLAVLGLVDLVVVVPTDHRLVGRDLDDLELVDLHELRGLGESRAGHAAELVVAA